MPNFLKSFRIRFWISSFWLGIMTISITPLNPSKNATINESETIGWRLLKASWMVNSFIRPYLNSCQGQITQETLNLIMFYHNHRRYKGGKRKGKAPIELLT